MVSYKYKKTAGALQEAPGNNSNSMPAPRRTQAPEMAPLNRMPAQEAVALAADEEVMHRIQSAPQQAMATSATPRSRTMISSAFEPEQRYGGRGMFFKTIEDGERMLVVERSGKMKIVEGPARVLRFGRSFRPMAQHLAHPGEFLIVRNRDGGQHHHAGPAQVWFDPREHASIAREEALPISSKEAVVVYTENAEGTVERRIVHGPATFVPQPGERLHTFSWHGNRNGKKVPGALEFQKLWMLPDQMYHDVDGVRTADDAVLSIRLMLFFQLEDIEQMLASTHDPIGDFLNAATSDVVDFVGRHSFETFKQHTEALNRLETYKQLTSRAEEIGYKIDRVVFRGYGAPESLQEMHDQAIESRTRLQLERATEEQAQQLEDQKLERELERSAKMRSANEEEVESTIRTERLQAEARRELDALQREFEREQSLLDARAERERAMADESARLEHLRELASLGVDLTTFLTHSRADKIFEFRGESNGAHLHLDS